MDTPSDYWPGQAMIIALDGLEYSNFVLDMQPTTGRPVLLSTLYQRKDTLACIRHLTDKRCSKVHYQRFVGRIENVLKAE